jgi:predicted transcriptional regulator
MDRASRREPWTRAVLALIAEHPGTAAGVLAEELGRERLRFKQDVRKLKDLGLTESLPVGYRLSPRGEAVLAGW